MRASGVLRVIAVVLAAAGCADAPRADTAETQEPTEGILATVAQAAAAAPQTLDISRLGVDRGAEEAPVHIVEFSDYGCGYCRKFHEETWPILLRDFVDAGKVEWKFLPYVSGMFGNTTAATTAAECVLEQGDTLFHTMNSLVWGHQSEWKRASDPASILRGLAHESGAELLRYDSCISQGRRTERIEGAAALARQVGVRGTPTFFVVGYPPIQGALPTDTFVQVLTMVYDEATRAGGPP
jgi:protein-disulfide isomerase